MKREEGKIHLLAINSAYLSPKMKTKAQYKQRNWKADDAALKQRGSITFWVNEEVIEQWRNQQKTGRKGASN